MTRDLETLLRDADPLRGRPADDAALLRAARERVDRERAVVVVPARRRHWHRRVVLIAAAAAVLTAVPLVLSALHGDDGGRTRVLAAAIAADGTITCTGEMYVSAVHPGSSPVRLLPDALPVGWSYTKIWARSFPTTGECIPPSLTALREDGSGLVTGRISVTGPVTSLDRQKLATSSEPDTLFGRSARRIDLKPFDIVFHRWFLTDAEGRQWAVEASGMPLDEARRELTAVSIDGSDVAWHATAAPGWTLVHRRQGAPYGIAGQLTWMVDLTDGNARRMFQVWVTRGTPVPLLAQTQVGERVTTVDGHPATLEPERVDQAPPAATETDIVPGTSQRVLVEVAPGQVAFGEARGDLPAVQQMLASLHQVPADDLRVTKFGTD